MDDVVNVSGHRIGTTLAPVPNPKTWTLSGNGTVSTPNAGNVTINIDASQNIFGVSSQHTLAGGNMTLADYYEIKGKITDGLDYSGAGLVRITEATVYVADSSELTADGGSPDAIQRAINLASNNDIINVQAGTFAAGTTTAFGIQVNKPVQLLRPGQRGDRGARRGLRLR